MKLIPINDVVIIEKDVEKTAGGIELLDSYKDPAGTDTGTVVNLRGDYKNEHGVLFSTDVYISQRVLFLRKHGIAVKGSKTLVAVRYENLLAVIEP